MFGVGLPAVEEWIRQGMLEGDLVGCAGSDSAVFGLFCFSAARSCKRLLVLFESVVLEEGMIGDIVSGWKYEVVMVFYAYVYSYYSIS